MRKMSLTISRQFQFDLTTKLLVFSAIYTLFLFCPTVSLGDTPVGKKVLILFEGSDVPTNFARGDARELAMLLGHFKVDYQVKGVEAYVSGEINKADVTFFIGYSKQCNPPARFLEDVYGASKQIVWMNTGIDSFSKGFNLSSRYGFNFMGLDTISNFDIVKAKDRVFTKDEPNLNIVSIVNQEQVEILATAYSSGTRKEEPYIVRSDNFIYIGDSPFASATETDRYVLFADMLHDILGEPHEEIHRALIRIEDVDLFENPDKLRDIADVLYYRHIPFLVGFIPYFVDPEAGIRLRSEEHTS